MRNALNRLTAVTLMAAVFMVMSFAMISEDTFAASKSPSKPKITKATVVNNNTVNLKWGKAKNAVKYKVYRKKADGKYVLVKTTAKRSYQNKKLAYGTKYTYKVTAVSKAGKKNTSKIKVVFTKPAKPVITANVQGINGVKVTWKSTKGAIKYKVYRKKAGGKYVLVKTTASTVYLGNGLAYDTNYTYKVKAVSKNNKFTESKEKAITTGTKPAVQTPAVPDAPAVPETPAAPNTPVMPGEQDCAAAGHNFQMTKISSPTCTEPGYKEYKCSRCGETKQEVAFEAMNHNWFVNSQKDSTYTEEGAIYYRCGRCGETKQEVIPKKEQPETPVTPDTPVVPEEPDTPSEPAEPSVPETPAEPEQPAERTVTVKVPIYETETVYWIKSFEPGHEGEIIYKTTDAEACMDKIEELAGVITFTYGTGAFDENHDGYGDEKYKIIVGYEEDTFTESEYNYLLENSDIGKMPGIIVIWND